jgi:hydroxypyruvate isomerase
LPPVEGLGRRDESGLPTTRERQAMVNATYTVNCSILLTDIPLLDRPRAARDAGFEAVEFWWPFDSPSPADADVAAFVHAIEDAGVQLTGLNFAAGDMPAGDRGILSNPALTQVFRDNVAIAIGIAEILGTRAFNALYGNRVAVSSPSTQDHVAVDNLAYAASAADRIGATVLLEPVSGAPHYPLKTASDVIQVIDRVRTQCGNTNIRLLADLYHLAVNGDDTSAAIRDYGSRVGHVQIADAPGRGEPGSGELALASQLQQLADRGYAGYLGLEYKATRPDPFDWIPRDERGANAVNIETLRQQQETRIS